MQGGHGRCAVILAESGAKEQYRYIILEGCTADFAFDAQCEGTRAEYLFRLTEFFEDRQLFYRTAGEAFLALDETWSWSFKHLCEFLTLAAKSGDHESAQVLSRKYAELKELLISKCDFSGYDRDRDHFNNLCISSVETGGSEAFLHAAEDIGEIMSKNPHYRAWDFDYFNFKSGQILGIAAVTKLLESSEAESVALYRQSMAEMRAEIEKNARDVKSSGNYRKKRAERLAKTQYDIPSLSELLYHTEARMDDGFAVGHHKYVCDLIEARVQGNAVSGEVFLEIYDTTLCSCCRSKTVEFLAEDGLLSDEIIRECLYDCNEQTRAFAEQYQRTNKPGT